MQRIPLHNFDDFLLCDDEDFAELSKYSWLIYKSKYTKGGLIVKAHVNVPGVGNFYVYPESVLFPHSSKRGTIWNFKDNNILNWQRDNIIRNYGKNNEPLTNQSHIEVPWCPFGIARLWPKSYVFTGGPQRPPECLACSDEFNGPYWQCLLVVVKTGWIGWRREDAS